MVFKRTWQCQVEYHLVNLSLSAGHDGKAGMAAVLLQSESDLSMPDLYSVLYENLPKYAIPLFIR